MTGLATSKTRCWIDTRLAQEEYPGWMLGSLILPEKGKGKETECAPSPEGEEMRDSWGVLVAPPLIDRCLTHEDMKVV